MSLTSLHDQWHKEISEYYPILSELLNGKGLELPKPEYGKHHVEVYLPDHEFIASFYPNPNAILSVELADQLYPPNQGQMEGGYTVESWLSGCDFDLKEPDALEQLSRFLDDPEAYMGYDRDCAFGERNSPLHKEYPDEECYHS